LAASFLSVSGFLSVSVVFLSVPAVPDGFVSAGVLSGVDVVSFVTSVDVAVFCSVASFTTVSFGVDVLAASADFAASVDRVVVVAGVVAGVAAYLSVAYLMRYFRGGRLDPFAFYCAAFGIVSLILLSR